MNTDKLNRWLTLAANVGVLVGLFLLVAELRQTNAIAKAEAINVMTQNTYTILQGYRDARNIAALNRVEEVGWDGLTYEEQLLLSSVEAMFMNHVQNAYYQHELGIFDDGQFDAAVWNMDESLQSPWRRTNWENMKDSYTESFRSFVEARLEAMAENPAK